MLSRHCLGTYQGSELTCNLSGNAWLQLSQLAEPLWTDPGFKKKVQAGIDSSEISPPPQSWYVRRKPPPPPQANMEDAMTPLSPDRCHT